MPSLLLSPNEWEFGAICVAIETAGGREVDRMSALGGSQEIGARKYDLAGDEMTVQSETYIGVTVFGSRHVLERVARLFSR